MATWPITGNTLPNVMPILLHPASILRESSGESGVVSRADMTVEYGVAVVTLLGRVCPPY
jgi:hypothetical protein